MTANLFHLQDGATPLFIACQEGHLPVVKHLIAAKADVNTSKEVGCLPLDNTVMLLVMDANIILRPSAQLWVKFCSEFMLVLHQFHLKLG